MGLGNSDQEYIVTFVEFNIGRDFGHKRCDISVAREPQRVDFRSVEPDAQGIVAPCEDLGCPFFRRFDIDQEKSQGMTFVSKTERVGKTWLLPTKRQTLVYIVSNVTDIVPINAAESLDLPDIPLFREDFAVIGAEYRYIALPR